MTAGTAAKVALVDVDGTLTTERSIWQFLMERTGCWTTAGAANLARFLAGEVDYHRLCGDDAALFAGRPYAELCELAATVPLREGAHELFAALRQDGFHVALVSTGLQVLNRSLADRLGAHVSIANDLEAQDGVCTGRAVVVLTEDGKAVPARRLIAEHGAGFVVAIGDSPSDLPLFALANVSIAVGPAAADLHPRPTHCLPDGNLVEAVPLIRAVAAKAPGWPAR